MGDSTPRAQGVGGNAPPPGSVLRAWGVDEVAPLPGGQGDAFRSGLLVFKPAPEPARTTWLADALDGLAPSETVRVARPARSVDGTWVVDGWTAWHWLDGEPRSATRSELLDVSARFHAAVAPVQWGAAMRGHDRWAHADRAAWGESAPPLPGSLALLAEARRPLSLPCQLVHGDLAGNVLFHASLPPAVIDISPYWRAARYADAIALVDRAVDHAQDERLDPLVLGPHGRQLLIRAVVFRALSEPAPTDAYEPLITQLLDQP
ncbi:hypothetical protein [Aquihabitans sp. McL0605]|uniref:hypothetical protein n=1 Tax=Aquihabitans sp. McL0605 TaxID=3415671 RepID=UPI003CEAD86A